MASLNQAQFHNGFDENDWMLPEEAAIYIRSFKRDKVTPCVQRVKNLIQQRRLQSYKPFGRVLIKRSELVKFMESSINGGRNVYK